MPEFTTHYLFGQSILDDFPSEVVSVIKNNLSAFNWGLQGPDLLFYSKVIRDSGRMARIGAALHHCNPDILFSYMLNYILTYKNRPDYGSLCGYFYGFVCHYALDSTVHPYVYALINKLDGQITTTRHVKIESEIGSLMYRRLTGMPVSSFNVYDHYSKKGAFVSPISKMYVFIAKMLLDKTVVDSEVKSGFSFCLFLNRFTYLLARSELNSSAKTALLKSTKLLVKKCNFLNSFIKSDNVGHDTLNLMHDEWCNFNNPQSKFSYSFPDLFDIAKDQAVQISQRCSIMLKSGVIMPLGLTENFDSGEPAKTVRVKSEKISLKRMKKSRA
jgi:hypothetical protein